MKEYKKTQKGFTLIELLMVVALIAILSTVILMSLDSGRERAEINRYFSYGTQMHRLAADAAAAGKFDQGKLDSTDVSEGTQYCLSTQCADTEATNHPKWDASAGIKAALTYLTKMPEATAENSQSPYNKEQGITITYKPDDNGTTLNTVRIDMYVVGGAGNANFVQRKCESIGWAYTATTCYQDVKLHSRL